MSHESFENYICRFCSRNVYDDPRGIVIDGTTHDAHTCYSGGEPDPEPLTFEAISVEEILGIPKEKANMSTLKVISRPTTGLLASSLNIGEFARIIGTSSSGDIVLKTRNGVVNLTNPSIEWPSFSAPHVERLNTGDKIEITVGFTANFEDRIRDIAKNDNKIMAIKAVREATQWGLKESKDYVEALMLKF